MTRESWIAKHCQPNAKQEEACLLCWLELFGIADQHEKGYAETHLGQCRRCQCSIADAESATNTVVISTPTWIERARAAVKRLGSLSSDEQRTMIRALANRIASTAVQAEVM